MVQLLNVMCMKVTILIYQNTRIERDQKMLQQENRDLQNKLDKAMHENAT